MPSVGRALAEGFRLASRSWKAIGLFVLAWLVVGMVGVAGLALTRPPAEALEQPTAPAETAVPPETAEAPAEAAAPAAEATPADTAQQRALNDWLGRSWPVLLAVMLLILAAGLLIQGGQIGYVVQKMRTGHAAWADITRAATQSFLSLLGAGALSIGAFITLALAAGLLVPVLGVLPGVVAGVLGLVLVVSVVAGVVWVSLRLALWPLVIVGERLGPIAGLKMSWRLSRGRWWTLLGIAAAFLAISIALAVVSGVVEGLGNVMGPAAGGIVQVANALAGLLANLFLSFATMGALVRFYEDAKGAGA